MPIERFQIHVSDEILEDLKYRLDHVRWPDPLEGSDWERGSDQSYLRSLVTYWREQFDWRAREAELNRLSHFRCNVDGIDVHFVHERGKGPNPQPIILTHGWPDSFVRYEKIIPMLTDPERYGGNPEDSFDVIVPSVPGFGFSNGLKRAGVNNAYVAELWARLMTEHLGYPKFAAAGGDIGSGVTRYLAFNHPELLTGIHLTDIGIIRNLLAVQDKSGLSEEELLYIKNTSQWMADEGGYMSIQSTKPQTLAYGLNDSPVGLAAWIIEKFHAWSDCKGDLRNSFSEDELLTNIMIYWVTHTAGSTANIYYENTHSLPPLGRIEVPTGIAIFPGDVALPPREWADRNLNITRWTTMPRGGHFTAMEDPAPLAEDIREFFRALRE
ncbi:MULTISPECIES: epoxide hydrolase family protein [unclassified Paenibacillus]|uniref:epoxide hydrolase family protein n=1 Tax=unclassified Paenibacillus TaxID=185978 RepID=UPI0004F89300|nr:MULTISPECIES: epoxide hydrolase family protein [unclassified Paenibacillus]AIQ29946.1 multidrug MFS transporter [Paenibacillus sp. FSL P4-0081]OMF25010.1 multidrug MFS transporter [Paenibacillus sp. FSL H8-0259]